MKKQSDWMVQVWENGGWEDYWPVTVYGTKRRTAVRRAPKVFCGEWLELWRAKKLRWRVGRMLRKGLTVVDPPHTGPLACSVCGAAGHGRAYHRSMSDVHALQG